VDRDDVQEADPVLEAVPAQLVGRGEGGLVAIEQETGEGRGVVI